MDSLPKLQTEQVVEQLMPLLAKDLSDWDTIQHTATAKSQFCYYGSNLHKQY